MTKHLTFNPTHEIDVDKYNILDTETNTDRRKVSKMINIKKHQYQALNAKTDLRNFSHSYNGLMDTINQ